MTDTVIPKRLQVHSDEAVQKSRREEKELQDRQAGYIQQMSKFSRHFREHLTGDQLTAAERLLSKIEITSRAGAATAAYDGIPVTGITFGSKTIADRTLDAFDHIRQCKRAIAEVFTAYDLFFFLKTALERDMSPQELGDYLNKCSTIKMGQKKRRAVAIELMKQATAAIISI